MLKRYAGKCLKPEQEGYLLQTGRVSAFTVDRPCKNFPCI